MVRKTKLSFIKELILAKKLLNNSINLIENDDLENNLIAAFTLNSALKIILNILNEKFKIKSLKQLDNSTLEKQWSLLSEEYKSRYGQDLSMKTQIFTLNNTITDFMENDVCPSSEQVNDLCNAFTIFMEDFCSKVFNLDFSEIDFHLLIENPQLKRSINHARNALINASYAEVLKEASSAYHIALEDQRNKLNYLSTNGLLKPELLMLDKSINIHIEPEDEDFIHLILHTPIKKVQRFKQLVPTVIFSKDESEAAKIVVSDFVSQDVITKENAEFCYYFALETILNWEKLDLLLEE